MRAVSRLIWGGDHVKPGSGAGSGAQGWGLLRTHRCCELGGGDRGAGAVQLHSTAEVKVADLHRRDLKHSRGSVGGVTTGQKGAGLGRPQRLWRYLVLILAEDVLRLQVPVCDSCRGREPITSENGGTIGDTQGRGRPVQKRQGYL